MNRYFKILCVLLLALVISGILWGVDYFVGPESDPIYNGREPNHIPPFIETEDEDGNFHIRQAGRLRRADW